MSYLRVLVCICLALTVNSARAQVDLRQRLQSYQPPADSTKILIFQTRGFVADMIRRGQTDSALIGVQFLNELGEKSYTPTLSPWEQTLIYLWAGRYKLAAEIYAQPWASGSYYARDEELVSQCYYLNADSMTVIKARYPSPNELISAEQDAYIRMMLDRLDPLRRTKNGAEKLSQNARNFLKQHKGSAYEASVRREFNPVFIQFPFGLNFGFVMGKPLLHPTVSKQSFGPGFSFRFHLVKKQKYAFSLGGTSYYGTLSESVSARGAQYWAKGRGTSLTSFDLGVERFWPISYRSRLGLGADASFVAFEAKVSADEKKVDDEYRTGFNGGGIRVRPFWDIGLSKKRGYENPSVSSMMFWGPSMGSFILRIEPIAGLYIIQGENGKSSFCLSALAQVTIGF